MEDSQAGKKEVFLASRQQVEVESEAAVFAKAKAATENFGLLAQLVEQRTLNP